MPNKKLDEKKLEFFKNLLFKLKESIVHDIYSISQDSDSQDSGDVSGHVSHMADVATDMYDREFNLGLASNEREILQKIEDALRRIQDGTYGFCLGTGKSISQARLKALPYAEYCMKYQEEIEEKESLRK